jgi:hypothetical protein
MKTLNWIAWISAGLGFLFVLVALLHILISVAANVFNIFPGYDGRLFGDTEAVNFYIASTNLFVITIAMCLIISKNQSKKE